MTALNGRSMSRIKYLLLIRSGQSWVLQLGDPWTKCSVTRRNTSRLFEGLPLSSIAGPICTGRECQYCVSIFFLRWSNVHWKVAQHQSVLCLFFFSLENKWSDYNGLTIHPYMLCLSHHVKLPLWIFPGWLSKINKKLIISYFLVLGSSGLNSMSTWVTGVLCSKGMVFVVVARHVIRHMFDVKLSVGKTRLKVTDWQGIKHHKLQLWGH